MSGEIIRIGFIADTHNDQYSLMRRAVIEMNKQNERINHLIHLGDFLDNYNDKPTSNIYRSYSNAARQLGEIRDEFGIMSVGIIPGNHDVRNREKGLCELEDFSINKKRFEIGNYTFLGYGGGYSFVKMHGWDDYDKQRYRVNSRELDSLMDGVDVVLMHQIDGKDKRQSLRPVLERRKPRIVVAGHTHKHGVEFYEPPMYANCGPIQPLDQTSHKRVGKSSFGVLELGGEVNRIKLYFFNKGKKGDESVLDTEIAFNPKHY